MTGVQTCALPISVHVVIQNLESSILHVNASVVRKEAEGLGLQISRISVDSFAQLRGIVSEKSDDSYTVMRETFGMLKCIY